MSYVVINNKEYLKRIDTLIEDIHNLNVIGFDIAFDNILWPAVLEAKDEYLNYSKFKMWRVKQFSPLYYVDPEDVKQISREGLYDSMVILNTMVITEKPPVLSEVISECLKFMLYTS